MRIDTSNLWLTDNQFTSVPIGDMEVQYPDEDPADPGPTYRDIWITLRVLTRFPPGSQLFVIDAAEKRQCMSFLSEAIINHPSDAPLTFLHGRQYFRLREPVA